MNARHLTVEPGIKTAEHRRPHVVILGAGASLAALPNGDKNGKRLPLMKDLVEVIGLTAILEKEGLPRPYDDFEAIYSDVAANPAKAGLRIKIEAAVKDYFSRLVLPDHPTVYDHLVLGLREKDVIATFNWDPFLWQAAKRNCQFASPPVTLFLHGNVAISYCPVCKMVLGKTQYCNKCGERLRESPLLYPVNKKNYQEDIAIASHWRTLQSALKTAYAITVFGYGAPKTDVEAVSLLKAGWGDVEQRALEETELIDLKSEAELTSTWAPFIHTHHYEICSDFYESLVAKHPRRTCEALWARLMECQFLKNLKFPQQSSFKDLYRYFKPKLDEEKL